MLYLLKYMRDQKEGVNRAKGIIRQLKAGKIAKNQLPQLGKDARLFAELCMTKVKDKLNNPHTKISNRLFSYIMMFWGISEHYCTIGYQKLTEFQAYKRTNSRTGKSCLTRCLKALVAHYQKKWICIGYNNVWYYRRASGDPYSIRDNIPLDKTSTLEIIEVTSSHLTFSLAVARRRIVLKVKDTCKGLYALQRMMKAFTLNHYTKVHSFGSFAPLRKYNLCNFFIRGEGYFKEVYKLIKSAKHEIMITGWFISPEFPLIRPLAWPIDQDKSTLCYVLGEAARERNVLIYVLVYKEFTGTLYTDSEHVKASLEKIHPNIKVIMHPKSFLFFWSHHEKMVIVDRQTVMLGGLDLAWGRWDNKDLKLFDGEGSEEYFPGVDYYNPFIKEFVKGRMFEKCLLDNKRGERPPRMPWHDYGVKLQGPIVFDYLTHFVTFWNYARDEDNEHHVLLTQFIHGQRLAQEKETNKARSLDDYQIMKAGEIQQIELSHVNHINTAEAASNGRETDERQRFRLLVKEIDELIVEPKRCDTDEGVTILSVTAWKKPLMEMLSQKTGASAVNYQDITLIEPENVNTRFKYLRIADPESTIFFTDRNMIGIEKAKAENKLNSSFMVGSQISAEAPLRLETIGMRAHFFDNQYTHRKITYSVILVSSGGPGHVPFL